MSEILSIKEIQKLLPQRYPFIMIDRVEIGENSTEIRAIKNVTTNEVYFIGHFPGNPIMPGVLQVEAVLQAGIIAFKKSQGRNEDIDFVIREVKKVRFKSPIIPGDQVVVEARIENINDNSFEIKASCKVAGVLKSQTHLVVDKLSCAELTPSSLTTNFSKANFNSEEAATVFSVNDISKYIPHRFPFQFIDKVIYNDEENIIGEKLVSANEPFATTYSAKNIFMPNVMILETMAQLGCVKLLSQEEHFGKIGLFLSIEDAILKRVAIPGDRLTFDVSFLFFKGAMGKAEGKVFCGNEEIASMTIAFALAEVGAGA